MTPKYKLCALLIVWGAVALVLILGNALAVSVTGIGMVVPIILIIAAVKCTNVIFSD